MDLQQTAALLARIAVIDNRKVDEATVLGWHEIMADLDYADSCAAVVQHRKTSRDYLTPTDVREGVQKIRSGRLVGFDANSLPFPGDPDDISGYLAWRRQMVELVASGQQPEAIVQQLVSRPMPELGTVTRRVPRK